MTRRALVLVWFLLGALAVDDDSTEPFRLRLVKGRSRCQGRLQVQRSGQNWTTVDPFYVPLRFGDRLCAELDCGSALTLMDRRVSKRRAVYLSPDGCDDTSLIQCFNPGTYRSDRSLWLYCSDSLRLSGGRSLCSGSVQTQDRSLNRSWTGVCEEALDRRGAEVLCRMLGCGAPLLQGALSPLGQTAPLLQGAQTRTHPETCSTLPLTCSEPVRLVGGASRCEGTVELKHRGEWRRMATFSHWDLESGSAVCRDLDCGSAISVEEREEFNISDVWRVSSYCVKKSSVRGCFLGGYSAQNKGVNLLCSESVRLIGGRSLCSGSVQIQDQSLNRSWTPVCEGALDRRGAEVLCRELDCGAPLLQGALSPLGQTAPLFQEVQMFHCEGHESALMDCSWTRTHRETCSTLQLTCSEPVRLVGGASRCEGTVELEHRGEWRRVVPSGSWDLESGIVMCRELNCGSAVSTEKRGGFDIKNVWTIGADCVKKSSVRGCVLGGSSGHEDGVNLLCSDLLTRPVVSVSEGVWAPRAEDRVWAPRAEEGDWTPQTGGRVWVLMGADFQIKCSVESQYPGGSFRLLSPTLNLTQPAVNHSAHFLFTDAGSAHRGNYTCVYLLHMFNHNFSYNGSLHIYPGESDSQFLLRALVLFLLQLLNLIPFFYFRQATRGHQRRQTVSF